MKLIILVEFFTLSIVEMEFVALSDTVLNLLAREDPELEKTFRGVFPADKLPTVPYWRVLVMLTLSTQTQLENQANIG